MSRATQDTTQSIVSTRTGLSPSMEILSSILPRSTINLNAVLQPQNCRNNFGLGSSHFARHYFGNHCYFLFLQVLRCFSSPGLLPFGFMIFNHEGCPIRKSTDLEGYLRLSVAYRSLSRPSSLSRAKASSICP